MLPEPVRILGLFGSPRRGGNTDILLEEVLKGAETEGASVERLYLSDFSITPCLECHGCDDTGTCVISDDMEKIYPKLLEADIIILASPIFFYGVTAWAKSVIDRTQPFWIRKYRLKDPSLGKEGRKRKGFFISVGATRGKNLFEGAALTAKYFFDVINADYSGELLFKGIESEGEILTHPEILKQAFQAGKRLASTSPKG